ncbi:MAG: ATP-binding cassette domain-containing protein [Pedobacter sp.]
MITEAVTLRKLQYRFAKDQPAAVDEVSAVIRTGRITGLVGPDGAGKTTLLRLMAGLLLPTSGTIRVFDQDTCGAGDKLSRLLGYMPQRFGLYEDLTVRQNLRLYADLQGVVGEERTTAFSRLLAFTALAPFQERLAGRLSGGMKQKLGLACALLRKPRLLLLDEPSVGVDPVSRRELWRMVQELVDETTAVVWSTAYLDEAEKCHDILLLNEGRLLHAGAPASLTDAMAGRCFQLMDITGSRRQVLAAALRRDDVQDGIIQGRSVRLITAKGETKSGLNDFAGAAGGRLQEVAPRFEDAFVDILGGGPGGDSALAAVMAPVAEDIHIAVEADGLTKKFGEFTAARNVSFAINRGQIFGLLGPNGAGKSTIFKMMCGLLRPTAGQGRVVGFDLQKASGQARSRLGYMAQKFSLYGDLSARQNLDFFSGIYGLTGVRQRRTVERMIGTFNLEPFLATSARELPLGFKQRLALACAVMHEPAVLFLDEPTSGVDPLTRREFWTHINGLVERGVTILVTTHFMDEAEYCDRIALIYKGQLISTAPPDGLKQEASSEKLPDPTLEDAFITLIERWDAREGEES